MSQCTTFSCISIVVISQFLHVSTSLSHGCRQGLVTVSWTRSSTTTGLSKLRCRGVSSSSCLLASQKYLSCPMLSTIGFFEFFFIPHRPDREVLAIQAGYHNLRVRIGAGCLQAEG